jgi:hypothetical protein
MTICKHHHRHAVRTSSAQSFTITQLNTVYLHAQTGYGFVPSDGSRATSLQLPFVLI